ncbi:hypothetical protein DPMN_025108 [Dreissena polymorpha]|uniref:Uncharacterized protein n=1 Tax=Dreissena polymorpha TaxID=45954 RepID=A0A9D4LNP5_DREPO|nr:hypothetical protein DPMN_025108 [Dreissena polymorpha]
MWTDGQRTKTNPKTSPEQSGEKSNTSTCRKPHLSDMVTTNHKPASDNRDLLRVAQYKENRKEPQQTMVPQYTLARSIPLPAHLPVNKGNFWKDRDEILLAISEHFIKLSIKEKASFKNKRFKRKERELRLIPGKAIMIDLSNIHVTSGGRLQPVRVRNLGDSYRMPNVKIRHPNKKMRPLFSKTEAIHIPGSAEKGLLLMRVDKALTQESMDS